MDAHERLMKLPLRGGAARDIPAVVLHCCLREGTWNPFYALVATQLARSCKHHRTTFQFAVWDHLKRLNELSVPQLTALARFLAVMITSQVRAPILFCVGVHLSCGSAATASGL
jgi:MA3 domain